MTNPFSLLANVASKIGAAAAVPPDTAIVTQERFITLTGIVIDSLEGGYYHPNMMHKFNARSQAIMKASGETMFGLDRLHGAQLAIYPEWKEFWNVIDKASASTMWKHEYRGGTLEPKLKRLVATIMYKWFMKLFSKYVTPAAQAAVAKDDRLIIHFSYASWNGEGWFMRFATVLNNAVKKTTDKEKLFVLSIEARTKNANKTIAQQGNNMVAALKKLHLI